MAAGAPLVSRTERKQTITALASAATPVRTDLADNYTIGPQDILDVTVFKVPELSRSFEVADSGTVSLPLIGETPVAGKTAHEVERELTAKLGTKYLRSPQVTVSIKEYNSQKVTVEGGIKKPGVYPVRGKTTLLQYVALAEGLDENSDSMVVVFREAGGHRTSEQYDIAAISAGQASDPTIRSGDVIVVVQVGS